MKKYLLYFGVWAGLSYPIYTLISPAAVVVYGVLSMAVLLIWACTRKKAPR
jgi:hypothetical protein